MSETESPQLYARMFTRSDLVIIGLSVALTVAAGVTHAVPAGPVLPFIASAGAVGRTSTFALCNVTLPWALQIANRGVMEAAKTMRPVAEAINVCEGEITNRAVAETFGMTYSARFDNK